MIYRTYSELDLLELLDVKIALDKKEDIGHMDMETILGTYEGHTILTIYAQYYDVYESLLRQLKETELDSYINSHNKQVMENKNLRRLYRILNMPTIDLKSDPFRTANPNQAGCEECLEANKDQNELCDCKGYKSVLHKSVYYTIS